VFSDDTEAFQYLLLMGNDISESALLVLEQFVVFLYNRTSDQENVNNAKIKDP